MEVSSRGWDTHQDNFSKVRELCGQIDQGAAQLITDLRERGMLERTLVLWMGECGRTPQINPRGGREHFPKAFNVALAGGGFATLVYGLSEVGARSGGQLTTIIILSNPADEAQALAVSDGGTPADKSKGKTN